MKVKEWFTHKMMEDVCKYGDMWMALDLIRNDDGTINVDADGYTTFICRCEVIKETDKAIQVKMGDVWNQWFPKSVIIK